MTIHRTLIVLLCLSATNAASAQDSATGWQTPEQARLIELRQIHRESALEPPLAVAAFGGALTIAGGIGLALTMDQCSGAYLCGAAMPWVAGVGLTLGASLAIPALIVALVRGLRRLRAEREMRQLGGLTFQIGTSGIGLVHMGVGLRTQF